MADSWLKADAFFDCPHCHRRSVETILAAADKHNTRDVADGIAKVVRPLMCQLCKKRAPEGWRFYVGMKDLTPDELAKLQVGNMPSKPM